MTSVQKKRKFARTAQYANDTQDREHSVSALLLVDENDSPDSPTWLIAIDAFASHTDSEADRVLPYARQTDKTKVCALLDCSHEFNQVLLNLVHD